MLLAATLPFPILSGNGFLLPVDGVRSSKAAAGAPELLSLPPLGLPHHKPPTATGSGQEGERKSIQHISLIIPTRDFPSVAFASFPFQILHSNSEIRPLCLQDRQRQLGDDREGLFRTPHVPPAPSHSHMFVIPLNVTGLSFFPITYKTTKKNNIIENFVMEKTSVGYTIQNHNSFFFPHCAPALCNWHLFGTDFKENVFTVQR